MGNERESVGGGLAQLRLSCRMPSTLLLFRILQEQQHPRKRLLKEQAFVGKYLMEGLALSRVVSLQTPRVWCL